MTEEKRPTGSVPCAPIPSTCPEGPLDFAALDDADGADVEIVDDDHLLESLESTADEPPFVPAAARSFACEDTPASLTTAPAPAPAPALAPALAPADPFATFARILEEVALAEGATPQAALFVRALLGESRTEGRSLPPAVERALVDGNLVTAGVRGLTRTAELCAQVVAWRSFLRGEADEVGGASSLLDEWAAELLARVIGEPHRAPAVRRELRARGVAAFGILVDAA